MANRSPSVSPLASPLRRMQAAGVIGRIHPYCSCRANFRSVKEVKACVSAFSDTTVLSKRRSPPRTIYNIKSPTNTRSTHNAITPEARCMMKDAVAEFSSPLTDVKKIPIRESPLFPIPASKRRKLFDIREDILKEVEMKNKTKVQKSESDVINMERTLAKDIAAKKHYERISVDQELRNIEELYPEFKFSQPLSLKKKILTKHLTSFDGEFLFSNTVSASLTNTLKEDLEVEDVKVTKPGVTDKSDSTQTISVVTVDKSLAEKFRPPEGSWECEICLINNKSADVLCAACAANRPPSSALQPQQPKVHVETDKELVERFKMSSDKWECDTCMIQNQQSVDKCVACEAPKPGSKPKMIDKVMANPLPLFTKLPTTSVFKSIPNTGSGSSLFQDIMNPSENNFNLFKNFPLLPPKPTSSSSIGSTITTTTTTTPISSSLSSIIIPQISSADPPKPIPAVSIPIGSSSLTQITAPLAVTATTTSTLQLPAVSIPLSFNVQSNAPLSKETTIIITTTAATTSPSDIIAQPTTHIPPFSPPRLARSGVLPLTPGRSADDEAMEVIPFIGTLTTPVKGSSSLPSSASPFSFQTKPETNPQPLLPHSQRVTTQFGASSIPALPVNSFQLPTTQIPTNFQFGGSSTHTPRQIHTDDSTGQKMKLFQFKSSSQPQGPFNPSTGGVTPVQSNSQPENIDTPIFRTSQVPVMSNLFAPQAKPVPSLFPSQTQQQQQQQRREPSLQQQIPSYQFGSQPAIFKQEPANPLSNVFKPTNVFSPNPNTGFPFSATGTTPHTPSTGFPFPPATQLPTQQITPTTPQTPTYGGFNMGASKPSSDVAGRVIKTARRRLPHNK